MKRILLIIFISITIAFVNASIQQPPVDAHLQFDLFKEITGTMQLKENGPLGPQGKPLHTVETLYMPSLDVEKYLEEDLQHPIGQPARYAITIPQKITPNAKGTWESLTEDVLMWRLRIVSQGAKSLNLGFEKYHMPPGGKLYIYQPDLSEVLGPYTEKDNKPHKQLWTPIIETDEIIIELTLPTGHSSELSFLLTSINHGYKELYNAEKSGSCNVDVICPQGDPWRDEIRSVGLYSFSGTYLCTGGLINNTAEDFSPYFLTANHCVKTSAQAASMVVYWNYQSTICRSIGSPENATPISVSGFPTQSGAYLRATYSESDFTLVELDDPVAEYINAFWSGWDRTNSNTTSSVTIHHPSGHEKRISFDDDPTTITSYLSTSIPGDGNYLRIGSWDQGTTEPGSSGAPLFNQNHRIVGQLRGGYAACGNNESDWYGRLYKSWTGGETNTTRLSYWLDPINSGVMWLNGLDSPVSSDLVISGNTDVAETLLSYPGGTTTSDLNGFYRINVPAGWSGTVTPSKEGYIFFPESRTYTNLITDQTEQNYTATPIINPIISGHAGLAGVTLAYTGGVEVSDSDGFYSISVPSGWSGTVTPSKLGYNFSPENRTYENLLTDQVDQNYTAIPTEIPILNISGHAGLAGAILTYTDGETISDTEGFYTISVPSGWSGTVTPIMPGYIFSPKSRNYNDIVSDQTGQDYIATISPTFADVDSTYWAWMWIEQLYSAGITTGCDVEPLRYCPENSVTRAEMAVFLLRGLYHLGYQPPPGAGSLFDDVSPSYWAIDWIEKLYADGITTGCDTEPLRYCPDLSVSRAEMAVFLLRSKYGADYSPPPVDSGTGFNDVPLTHWAADWIKQLVSEEITTGCGNGNYCPEDPVTRAEMAAFLLRTFDIP